MANEKFFTLSLLNFKMNRNPVAQVWFRSSKRSTPWAEQVGSAPAGSGSLLQWMTGVAWSVPRG